MTKIFQEGDPVLLIYDERRRWIKTIEDSQFHCNYGYINLLDIVGLQYGSKIETNKEKWLRVRPPRLLDWIESFKHQSQIIYAKDAAHIVGDGAAFAGLCDGHHSSLDSGGIQHLMHHRHFPHASLLSGGIQP